MTEFELNTEYKKFSCKHRDEEGCCEFTAYMGVCMFTELCAHTTEESEV